jgi:hypothetical protein
VAQPLQRRRHQEPAKPSRMAPRSRSLGRQTPTAKLDQRRHRKRTIPTANALRAELYVGKSGNLSYITRNHRNKDPARRRGSALETNCFATCDASRKAADFFTCFGYNPLKSIDSAKEIQINPRVFIWISLDFLAAGSRPGCRNSSNEVMGCAGALPAFTLALHRGGGTGVSLLAIHAPVA